jgi:hypothetical protein
VQSPSWPIVTEREHLACRRGSSWRRTRRRDRTM